MNDLFIRAAYMDWDGIGKDSYLWTIDAIAGVDSTPLRGWIGWTLTAPSPAS